MAYGSVDGRSVCGNGFRAAVADWAQKLHLWRELQRQSTLCCRRLRLLLYHTIHRILYDAPGRGRACQEIALPAKEKRRKRSRNPFWGTSLTSYWRILLFSECASSIPILKSLRLRKNKGRR